MNSPDLLDTLMEVYADAVNNGDGYLGRAQLEYTLMKHDLCLVDARDIPAPAQAERETCPTCTGSGYSNHPDSGEICPACGGQGVALPSAPSEIDRVSALESDLARQLLRMIVNDRKGECDVFDAAREFVTKYDIRERRSPPLSSTQCAGGVDPGWDECPKCGATSDDACAVTSTNGNTP